MTDLSWWPLLDSSQSLRIDAVALLDSYILAMSALRVAARRLPRASRLVQAVESPIQRRFAVTSNAPQDVKKQAQV